MRVAADGFATPVFPPNTKIRELLAAEAAARTPADKGLRTDHETGAMLVLMVLRVVGSSRLTSRASFEQPMTKAPAAIRRSDATREDTTVSLHKMSLKKG